MSAHAIDVGAHNFDEVVIRGSRERPVLADFWAHWCGTCRTLGPILDKLVAEMAGRFTLAKLNTDEQQELAQHFRIRSIPTVFAIVGGRPADQFQGELPEGQLREFIKIVCP